ncbi:IS3 family transposase [Paenochrobactrum glaciei]|uniref:IS3 family transposase n=1 Tax=Paenochrobactrum glaciei TaxID=486407 RepID=UPI0031E16947
MCSEISRVYAENRKVYGARKVWHALRREGDLSPNTPPFFRRVLGYTIGLKRPVFLEPFLWRTHSV